MKRYSYVTICTNTAYVKGVLLLNESLKFVKSAFPLVCVVPIKVDKEVVSILSDYNIEVKYIENEIVVSKSILENNKRTWWNETFFKFYVFGLTEYEKIVFLDSDMIIINNIDNLFDKPHMTACCCWADKLSYPEMEEHINSGLMVIEPDEKLVERLIAILYGEEKTYYGDQDVIDDLYPEWAQQKELRLSVHYNAYYRLINYFSEHQGLNLDGNDPVRVIHYIGRLKPWMKKDLRWKVKYFFKDLAHFKEKLKYKNSVKFQVDQYYQKIASLVDTRSC